METESIKMLALKLHNLNEKDRHWILSRVGSDVRENFEALILELDELGISLDDSLLDSVNSRQHQNVSNRQEVALLEGSDVASINQASRPVIDVVFEDEPEMLFNALLMIKSWSWGDDVQTNEYIHSKNFNRPNDKKSQMLPKQAVQDALIKAVGNQLKALDNFVVEEGKQNYPPQFINENRNLFARLLTKVVKWEK